jgi:hypothetical protein
VDAELLEACCFDGWVPDGLPEGGGAEWASFWCGEDEPIVNAWCEVRRRDESVALMANTNHTVHRLNQLTQQRRIATDELDPNGPALHLGQQRLLVGDEVVTRRNQRTLRTDHGAMVKNRDHWTIEAIHTDGAVTVTGPAGRVRLPADYAIEDLELGYAQTSHATQGRTVDTSLLLVDGPIDGRGLYTPLTRGRHTNHAYVATSENETAADVLTQAIARDWIDQPAITQRTRLEAGKALNLPLGHNRLEGDLQAVTHPPDHDVGKPDLSPDDYQTWQKINRSIEAARQRHVAERSRNRHTPGLGR